MPLISKGMMTRSDARKGSGSDRYWNECRAWFRRRQFIVGLRHDTAQRRLRVPLSAPDFHAQSAAVIFGL